MGIKLKYPRAIYKPKSDCRWCGGSGLNNNSNINTVTGAPFGETPCVCLVLDHRLINTLDKPLDQKGGWGIKKNKVILGRGRGIGFWG